MKKTNKLVALIVAVMLLFSATTAFAVTYVSDPVSPSIANPGGGEALPETPEEALPTEEPGADPEETSAPDETATPEEPAEVEAVVRTENAGSSVNIRAAASMDAEIIGKLTSGMRVVVLGTEGDWTKIRADGLVGYVYSNYISFPQPETEEATEVAPAVEQVIRIASNLDTGSLKPGDVLTLSAELIGFDGLDYSLNWQVKRPGGDWEDISGATGTTLTIEITEAHNGCSWRLRASIDG